MRALLVLLAGCATIQQHPIGTAVLANSAVIAGAATCAAECSDRARAGLSEGVLVVELELSSAIALTALSYIIANSGPR